MSVAVGLGLGFGGFDGQSAQQQVAKAHSSCALLHCRAEVRK